MIGAIVGHLVGDYLFQNDWQALNKKKQWTPLIIHCAIWTVCVMAFGGACNIWAGIILFCLHAVQDGTNIIRLHMRLVGQEQFATGPLSPWSIVVVDNVCHIVTIYFVWKCFGLS